MSLFALRRVFVDAGTVSTEEQTAELRAVINSRDVPTVVATRARIVLWMAEGRQRRGVTELAGVSLPTLDRWGDRYAVGGLAGLADGKRGAPRQQVSAWVAAWIPALTRASPPMETGLSHWSSRQMAAYLGRTVGMSVSWHYVAKLWRDNELAPHRSGTFKLSRDPRFADKVADVVGLYLDPPGGAVVLSIDEKTQIQALDRTQSLLPLDFGLTEKRTHDYRRHGITHMFAALDVGTGKVSVDCYPRRSGAEFLAFLRKAVKPHVGKQIRQPVHPRQAPPKCGHCGPATATSASTSPRSAAPVEHDRDLGSSLASPSAAAVHLGHRTGQPDPRLVQHWTIDAEPFTWTATADDILAKVAWVQTNVKQLVNNNAK